jgi:hydrogenase large subunit
MTGTVAHPAAGTTRPDVDKPGGYSFAKAPRLGGEPVEVGALARQVADGHPLAQALLGPAGRSNVRARVVARMIEIARLLPLMEDWARGLDPAGAYAAPVPDDITGTGEGLVEAARGMLGHWVHLDRGRIAGYQIVAPTTWNFSPRDSAGIPGPLEQALTGIDVGADGAASVTVQHVVRSFDPCMVCTAH